MAKSSKIHVGDARVPDGMRVYAIGDIHGCLTELTALLEIIDQDVRDHSTKKHRLIFIGDYVDRGPDCKGVIDRLIALQKSGRSVTCLKGNHEEKLIKAFTAMDAESFPGFVRYGGLETLASYDFPQHKLEKFLAGPMDSKAFAKFSKRVRKHLGESHVAFLNGLGNSTQEGDYFFCHAGVDPTRKFDRQRQQDLVWMREPFLSWSRPLAKVVVHGHTPALHPEVLPHRINIDTGCVYNGQLTALVLEKDHQTFLKVDAKAVYYRKTG